MDLLDLLTAIFTVAVVIAAFIAPISGRLPDNDRDENNR